MSEKTMPEQFGRLATGFAKIIEEMDKKKATMATGISVNQKKIIEKFQENGGEN